MGGDNNTPPHRGDAESIHNPPKGSTWLRRISMFGVPDRLTQKELKFELLANKLLIAALLVGLGYMAFQIFISIRYDIWAYGILQTVAVLVVILNIALRIWLGRIFALVFLIVTTAANFFTLSLFLGNRYPIHLILMLYLALPFLVFGHSEADRKAVRYSLIFIALANVARQFLLFDVEALVPFPDRTYDQAIVFVVYALIMILVAIPTYNNWRETTRLEANLDEARQKAMEASEAKGRFLANMSHEIRTPMTLILGMSDLLGQTQLTTQQKQYVNMFRRAGQSLLNIINDILEYSKTGSAQFTLEHSTFHLGRLLTELDEIFSQRLQEKGLRFSYAMDTSLFPWRSGDIHRVRQVLTNLIGNAIKFTPAGFIHIKISENSNPDFPGNVLFTVSDSGIGIAPDRIGRLFQAFTQADYSVTRVYGGTGLGLVICKNLVTQMGGKIEARSEPGSGAQILFSLELPEASPVPDLVENEHDLPAEATETQLTILLAEDASENALLFQAMLRKRPYAITVVENGVQAVEKAQVEKFDMIFMDIQMPLMDGYTATRKIREWESKTGAARTPIIALTAYTLAEEKQKCFEAGCDFHLAKPYNQQAILETIAGALVGQSMR